MNTARRSVKDSSDNRRQWRNKFKQQCSDRMKEARQNKIDKIREDQLMHSILEQEWDIFKNKNEEAMRNEGIDDIDNLIEESMLDNLIEESMLDKFIEESNFIEEESMLGEEAELFLREEEEHLSQAINGYQAIICVNCQKAALIPAAPVFLCPKCGFHATEMCLKTILQANTNHSLQCHGLLSYALEPGTDYSIFAVCNTCDLWDMF